MNVSYKYEGVLKVIRLQKWQVRVGLEPTAMRGGLIEF